MISSYTIDQNHSITLFSYLYSYNPLLINTSLDVAFLVFLLILQPHAEVFMSFLGEYKASGLCGHSIGRPFYVDLSLCHTQI